MENILPTVQNELETPQTTDERVKTSVALRNLSHDSETFARMSEKNAEGMRTHYVKSVMRECKNGKRKLRGLVVEKHVRKFGPGEL